MTTEQKAKHAAAQRRYYARKKAGSTRSGASAEQLSVFDFIDNMMGLEPSPVAMPRAKLTPEERRERHRESQRRYYQRQKEKRQAEPDRKQPTPKQSPESERGEQRKRVRKPLTPEQKRKHAESQRKYYQKKKLEKKRAGLTNKEKGLIKGANALGFSNINEDNVKDFADYISYRYAQNKDSQFYDFDRWGEEYAELCEDMSAEEIEEDFNRFVADRADLEALAESPNGMSEEVFEELWEDYMESKR